MGRVHYAWVVAGSAFVALVMAAGFRSAVGILIVPLHDEFGWSHETIAGAVSLNLVCFGIGAPFAAAFVERFGMRRVVSVALTTVALSALATTRMTQPWQLYLLWGLVNGLATGAISVPLAAIVSTRWFVRRQGLVTGLLTASNASGQLIFLPLLAWIAGFDWRWAAAAVAGVAVFFVLPIVTAFMRDRPADIGLLPYGSDGTPEPAPVPPRPGAAISALRGAASSRAFWVLAGTFFICGATTTGLIQTHLIPAAHDHGIPEVTAASLLAVIGLFDLVGTIGSGWLSDRYDSRILLVAYYGFRGLALLLLPFVLGSASAGLIAFAVVYGLDWVATVPPTVALTAATFGRERTGLVFGWIFSAHQLGAAAAAWGAGAWRTGSGDYSGAFLGAGALAIAAALLIVLMRRATAVPAPATA